MINVYIYRERCTYTCIINRRQNILLDFIHHLRHRGRRQKALQGHSAALATAETVVAKDGDPKTEKSSKQQEVR